MSQLGQPNPQSGERLQTTISVPGDSLVAPRTNGALELAGSLAEIAPKANELIGAYADEEQKRQGELARKAAMDNAGARLADATRDGKISPTQNPWWVQAYNREAAYLRAEPALTNLHTQSSTWAEKNDPVKFQDRWNKETADLSKSLIDDGDEDQAAGWAAALGPATQQAVEANGAEVSANMVAERNTNTSNLIAVQLQHTNGQYGGAASPGQLSSPLEQIHQNWLRTGGTETDWDKRVTDGYFTAAFNTKNGAILDHIPDRLKNQPEIAQQIERAQYYIHEQTRQNIRDQMETLNFNTQIKERQYQADYIKQFGPTALTSPPPPEQFAAFVAAHAGDDPAAMVKALNGLQGGTADAEYLMNARAGAYANSPQGKQVLLQLHSDALTTGMTDQLNAKVGSLLLRGDISYKDAESITTSAINTTRGQLPSGVFGKATPEQLRHQEAITTQAEQIHNYMLTRDSIDARVNYSVKKLNESARVAQAPGLTPSQSGRIVTMGRVAADTWLKLHPGDYDGARNHAEELVGMWLQQHAATLLTPRPLVGPQAGTLTPPKGSTPPK